MIIISLTRFIGFLLRKLKQPAVVAEVIGGIILGPTVMFRIPGFQENIFPKSSLSRLKLVADIGKILYLFMFGLELDLQTTAKNLHKSIKISLAGIILTFFGGFGVSLGLYDRYMNRSNVPFFNFFLFCGTTMSITAFPVLAEIMTQQKLINTNVGQLAYSAAGTDDVIAWCLLISVVAFINNPTNSINALYVFIIVVAFAAFLWFAIRPILFYLVDKSPHDHGADQFNVSSLFLIVCVAAFFTEAVGCDMIFGSFLVGLITPHTRGFSIAITEKIEDLVSILFLPLYFAYAGLGVQLGLLNDGTAWAYVALVLAVACGCKVIGCSLAARIDLPWRESFTIGFLMNTKGLVELVVLNLGLQAGVISQTVYAIFLIMALTTTFMTAPIVGPFVSNFRFLGFTPLAIEFCSILDRYKRQKAWQPLKLKMKLKHLKS